MTDSPCPSRSGPHRCVSRCLMIARISVASHNFGIDIIRPQQHSPAPETFRNGFHLCRQLLNDPPGLTATEDHMTRHMLKRVEDGDTCVVTARKVYRCSERNGGSHREIDGRENAPKLTHALFSCLSVWQHEHWYRRPTRHFACYPAVSPESRAAVVALDDQQCGLV